MKSQFRSLVCIASVLLLLALIAKLENLQAADPASPESLSTAQRHIKELEAYYAKLYGQPLDSPDRLAREIAIVSLSRIDAPDTLQRLFDALKPKDHDPIISYLAWEALHARYASMSPEQRLRWVTAGVQAANAGAFPGATVIPLLQALAEHPSVTFENDVIKLANKVIQENDPQDDTGRAALNALADLVVAWHDPALIRALQANLGRADWALRIDRALRKLPDPPDTADPNKLPGFWRTWSTQHAQLKAATAQELKPYVPASTLFPKPEKITDALDKKWRGELEIGKLTVSDFDLVWCIDSTGSMNEENQMVAAETAPIIRACALISKRARCGTIYYRHETEAALMKPCCQRAANDPKFYQVKGYPLTVDARALAAKMAAEVIPKPDGKNLGNVHPGCALYSAVKAAMGEMNWSTDKHARRIIAIVGDAMVTPGSEKACEEIGAQAKSKGYLINVLLRPKAKETWDPFIKSSGGTYYVFTPIVRPNRPQFDPASELAEIMSRIVSESVAADYKNRVDPLIKILIPYAKAAELAEHRAAHR